MKHDPSLTVTHLRKGPCISDTLQTAESENVGRNEGKAQIEP